MSWWGRRDVGHRAACFSRGLRVRCRGGRIVLGAVEVSPPRAAPPDGEPGYIGLTRDGGGELAVTHEQWAADRYGFSPGTSPRLEMYVYVNDLEAMLVRLTEAQVTILRAAEDMPWGERIATVADPEGNPVALCQTK
jgi:predicted enzyme related to lactoylglutathione lyase